MKYRHIAVCMRFFSNKAYDEPCVLFYSGLVAFSIKFLTSSWVQEKTSFCYKVHVQLLPQI